MNVFVVELEECAVYRYEVKAASREHAINKAREQRNKDTKKDKTFVAWAFRETLPEPEEVKRA